MEKLTKIDQAVLNTFDIVVDRSYLSLLSDAQVVPLPPVEEGKMRHPWMTWYRITKIVKEKQTFMADKLSMLYAALHEQSQVLALLLNKDKQGHIELLIGVRDSDNNSARYISREVLKAGLKGFLPGVTFEEAEGDGLDQWKPEKTAIASVSGVGSLRDDKKESFIQGIERLINSTNSVGRYSALFLAHRLDELDSIQMLHSLESLYTSIAPLEKAQLTYSHADSESVSAAIGQSISDTVSENIGKTVTQGETSSKGTSQSSGKSSGQMGGLSAIFANYGYNRSTNESWSDSVTQSINTSKSESASKSASKSSTLSSTDTIGKQATDTVGNQITITNRHVKSCLAVMDKQIDRLRSSTPYGLWNVCTYFISPNHTTSQLLAGIYRGTIVGDQSHKETLCVNSWPPATDASKAVMEYLREFDHPQFYVAKALKSVTAGSIVNSKELAIHLSLPQSSVPGILVREEECFGRNVISPKPLSEENSLRLGAISHLGEVSQSEEVRVSISGLSKHTFVTGTTGSGKTNTLYLLLDSLMAHGVKCMIIEPAKGEYKDVFGQRNDIKVYSNNPRISAMLRINPFEFPGDVHVYEHIDQLVEIFNACWPMYAAMPQVLKHSIEQAYKNCGWDLINSYNSRGIFPSVPDVLEALKEYINTSEYSSDTKGDYKGSLETRLQSLCDGITGQIFSGTPIPDSELFGENVIIDLSRVKSSETKSLLMGLLVMKLGEYRSSEHQGMNLPLRHVTVLEEAHNLLKRTNTQQNSEGSNVAGMAVEKIANSIAEMRTYGEGFIIADQSPSLLDQAAIRNTNTKVLMSLPDKDDREMAGKAVGLTDKQINEISRLKIGEAVVFQNGWEEAVKCQIDYYPVPETQWQNQPEPFLPQPDEKEPMLASYLYTGYAGINEEPVHAEEMEYLINDSRMSGARKAAALDTIEGKDLLEPEDFAVLFTALVGTLHFREASAATKNVEELNQELAARLSHLPCTDPMHINTYVNMYVQGCSLKSAAPFYQSWLEATIH